MKLIHIIDDDEQIRRSFGMALRNRGYRVIESDNGTAGLELARQQMPDLILTDINMPGGDGQTLLKHIRADPELCSKQVVLMTGRPDLVPPRRGMEQGADDFLVKPIMRDALLACMEARLSRAAIHWRVEDRELSKLRSSMTSQLPHELFTPLAGILGLSELLKNDSSTLSHDEIRDFSQDIHQSALRLHHTVRNYLLVLESQLVPDTDAQLPGALSPAKLQESLKTGVDLAVERQGRGKDISLQCGECLILMSAPDLALIVEELVDNALKFSREGTAVGVTLDMEGVLLITDAGRGMSKDEIEHIGAFHQFDRKKYEQQGLGLGLALVQKLSSRNGAKFSADSMPEHGTQARIKFQLSNSTA
jgi:two-component system sensor histidine kinase/response regulator